MSPATSLRDDGIPWTTCSFTDAQMVAGYPWYPLNAGSAPASRNRRSARASTSAVVTPGAIIAASSASTRATSALTRASRSSSAADRQVIIVAVPYRVPFTEATASAMAW